MRVLYLASTGPDDPTRASIPFHLAVNGSAEVGQDVQLVLAGDATGLLEADVRDGLVGVGVPPLRELLAKVAQHSLPVFV
ncbi:MAG: hypothetical protein KY454_04825 [Actinobacteria bacterium]|nr:hypothetical protein [Actinomycetota bacterium]MBW3649859.1 hypothetical protein [Actinomycetota bacterium]